MGIKTFCKWKSYKRDKNENKINSEMPQIQWLAEFRKQKSENKKDRHKRKKIKETETETVPSVVVISFEVGAVFFPS